MGRKGTISYEMKLDVFMRCLSGKTSQNHEAVLLGISNSAIRTWINNYKILGNKGAQDMLQIHSISLNIY